MHFDGARVQRRLSVTFLGSSPVLSLRAPFGPVRLASSSALFVVLPGLETEDCALELPVVRQACLLQRTHGTAPIHRYRPPQQAKTPTELLYSSANESEK